MCFYIILCFKVRDNEQYVDCSSTYNTTIRTLSLNNDEIIIELYYK